MTNQRLDQELDPNPLVVSLFEKTKAGRLQWKATADEHTFIVSVGGDTTLMMILRDDPDEINYGRSEQAPVLCVMDSKGRTLDEIFSSQVKGGLWPLYRLAQRIGNKLDEKMATLMEVVEKL